MIKLKTPFSEEVICQLKVGDVVSISGYIFCGRDAVLPRICEELKAGTWGKRGIDLQGGVIFHTAVFTIVCENKTQKSRNSKHQK